MLHSFFFDTAAMQPAKPALWVDERLYDYGEIASRARRVSAGLGAAAPAGGTRRCLLFASRSLDAYVGLLGILDAGMAYIPLIPKWPAARVAAIIEQSGAPLMLVDRRCAPLLDEVLSLLDEFPQIFLIDEDAEDPLLPGIPDALARLEDAPYTQPAATPDGLTCILFTSGSTGIPKGVPISHANTVAYVRSQLQLEEKCEKLSDSRYVQFCELSFDPSIHDMFVCWANSGCLYVPKTADPVYNAGFIKTHEITHWNSVPSVAGFMRQLRKLRPDEFPSLRFTLFGGEPLSCSLAQAWMRAAPNSRLRNIYGPTEATVSCTSFEVTAEFLDDPQHVSVPLGWATPGMELLIVDPDLEPVAPGQTGELLIGGPQLANGYLLPSEAGNSRFVVKTFPGQRAQRWYRSSDAARESARHGIVFQGRLDTQVKIRGNRVELEEVEHVVQACSHGALCAVVPWPLDEVGRAIGLTAFVTNTSIDAAQILQSCRQQLPVYAVPEKIVIVDTLPLNVNGKIDRKALAAEYMRGQTVG